MHFEPKNIFYSEKAQRVLHMQAAMIHEAPNIVLPPMLSPKHNHARMVANTGSIVNIIVVSALKANKKDYIYSIVKFNQKYNIPAESDLIACCSA